MIGTIAPYRSARPAGRSGFAQLLRAEWTKFRTVRGWVLGMVGAALLTVVVGLLVAAGRHVQCGGPSSVCPAVPVGPNGEAVNDKFYFVHQPLAGDGSIVVRVTSLSGIITYPPPDHNAIVPGVVPWAKAGIIIKQSTEQGSAYAAVMVTGARGVRMQYDYTHDLAGLPGTVSAGSPRWLRLTRSGDTIAGYESTDGTHWTKVGTTRLAGLTGTVQVGLFVTSPCDLTVNRGVGGGSNQCRLTEATAIFDHVSLQGTASSGEWSGDDVGAYPGGLHPGGFDESGGTFTVTGWGDIAPLVDEPTVEQSLIGAFAGLIVVVVLATLFVTAEFRRGLIRTTLAASPRRGRVLAAKAIVIGSVTLVAGLVGSAVALPVVGWMRRHNGESILPVTSSTQLRVVVGTAALLAIGAILALAVGTMVRRSAAAVTAVIVLVVLPYILAVASILPASVTEWLLRLSPAAAFAIQQTMPRYPQVISAYTLTSGYFPMAPWAGFAVLCGWTALALGLAAVLLRRRDA
jgi:ABC-type transport system involved in multi-copper enzyme maturation permease subunit